MFNNRADIEKWLEDNEVSRYIINDDLSVDIDGSFALTNSDITELPVQFNSIKSSLYLNNNKLTTLKGCPKYLGGHFIISYNNLTSLEYCPEIIKGTFDCRNNKLKSLEYGPKYVGKDYVCAHNNLKSLEHCTDTIFYNFDCSVNKLWSLKDLPSEIGGNLYVSYQEIMNIFEFNTNLKGTFNHAVEANDMNAGNVIRNLKDYYEPIQDKYMVTLSMQELKSIILHQQLTKSVPNKDSHIKKKKI